MIPAAPDNHSDDSEPLKPGPAGVTRRLRVAVLHNSKEFVPSANGHGPKDALAELDTLRNVREYVAAIGALGHEVVALEGSSELPQHLAEHPVDLCFNTCEGLRGDSREAQVPALLEMMGVPYSGSKVLSLAVTLDKAMTKRVLAYYGLPTPAFQELTRPGETLHPALRARLLAGQPLFVKPNSEGTGKGIYGDALVRSEAQLHQRVAYLIDAYHQPALVEEYVEGRDVTCGLVGNLRADGSPADLHLFPISELDYSGYPEGTEPFYSHNLKVDLAEQYRYWCPAPLPEPLAAEVRRLTVETFRVCGCLDFARVDFRLDAHNNWQPMILEINALPGLAYNSDLVLCAEAEGWTYHNVVQAVFGAAVRRYGLDQVPRGERQLVVPGLGPSLPLAG